MAWVKPFKGLRPPKDLVERVECRPYDVLSSEEARIEGRQRDVALSCDPSGDRFSGGNG